MKYLPFNIVELLARNVVFTDKTDEDIKYLLHRANNPIVKKWINNNIVKNLLQNSYPGKEITDQKRLSAKEKTKADPKKSGWLNKINHENPIYVIDVRGADRNKWSHWIDYLNTLNGNINFGINQIEEKVQEWEEALYRAKTKEEEEEKRRLVMGLAEDGIEDIHVYPNGFKWVRVFGKNSLNREGEIMQHCVGSYYNVVKANEHVIYSLRDKNNVPHCTIDYIPEEKIIDQIKGFKNTTVSPKYILYVKDFLDKSYVKYEEVNLDESGLIKINDKLYRPDHLPGNLQIDGALDLSEYKSIKKLPKGLKVTGKLNLRGTEITELPDNLKVDGDLILSVSKITKIPDKLDVGGSLHLFGTKITKLPNNLTVGGELVLSHSGVRELPENLQVGGSLDISISKITKLPAKLKVGGELKLDQTEITTLPDNLEIDGDLNLSDTNITKLPDNLKVGGDLNLSNTDIKKLPSNLKVGYSLNLSYTDITKLPDVLKLEGDLILSHSKVTKLPPNLEVGGGLVLSYTQIFELPANLKVNYSLDVSHSKITKLPNKLKLSGNLDISFTNINKLPNELEVGGSLNLSYSKVTQLPANLKVGGLYLEVKGTKINEIPPGLDIKSTTRII